jgi:hypothetical protein
MCNPSATQTGSKHRILRKLGPRESGCVRLRIRKTEEKVERETGIEPATNGLGSRYSTIELLPLC